MNVYVKNVYNPTIARKALERFQITEPSLGDPQLGSNAVVKVTSTDGEFALRLHRASRSADQIEQELDFVHGLHQTNSVCVPAPVRLPGGGYCCTVKHSNQLTHCSLLTWLRGVSRSPGEGFGIEKARQTGEALAAIHLYSQSLATRAKSSDDFRLTPGLRQSRWPGRAFALS